MWFWNTPPPSLWCILISLQQDSRTVLRHALCNLHPYLGNIFLFKCYNCIVEYVTTNLINLLLIIFFLRVCCPFYYLNHVERHNKIQKWYEDDIDKTYSLFTSVTKVPYDKQLTVANGFFTPLLCTSSSWACIILMSLKRTVHIVHWTYMSLPQLKGAVSRDFLAFFFFFIKPTHLGPW